MKVNNMKRYIIFMLLMLTCAISMNAQWSDQSHDAKTEELRHELNIDYSMPDYSVKKIDEKTIGPRLAKQLQYLMAHYKDHVINDYLSEILYEQTGDLRYTKVKTLKILEISKQGNTITIRTKASLAPNPLKLSTSEIPMTFVEGVSDIKSVNSIFSYISRYIKE